MISSGIIVIIIIIGVILLFSFEVFSIEVTALLVMVVLMLSGVITVNEAASGFSNSAALTVLAMLILSAALQDSGVITFLGRKVLRVNISNEFIVMAVVMILAGVISAFINNTAVVAIFLPMTIRLARQKNLSANKLLMSLSFGAMLGGSCTLIGSSTNLLVSEIAVENGLNPLTMFELSPVGSVLFGVLIVFLVFIGHNFISTRRKKHSDLTQDFQIQDYLSEIVVNKGSELIGKDLNDSQIQKKLDIEILQIIRKDGITYLPEDIEILKENDILVVKTNARKIIELQNVYDVKFRTMSGLTISEQKPIRGSNLKVKHGALVEVIISPNSKLIHKKIKDIPFRETYKAIPLAVRRKRGLESKQPGSVRLDIGYSMLLETTKEAIKGLYASEDFILINEYQRPKLKRKKAIISISVILAVVLLASFNVLPILVSAWAGCVLLFMTQTLDVQKMYTLVDWRIYFLLAGIIPLGLAVEKSGASDLITGLIVTYLFDFGPYVILSFLFFVTVILSAYISNNAVAVLIAPIGIAIASELGLDARPFLFAIIYAANCSFLTPVGYQTNTMIYGAGQFKFKDFLLTGGLMTLIAWIITSVLIPLIYF